MRLRVIVFALVATAVVVGLVVAPSAGAKSKPVKPGQFVTYTVRHRRNGQKRDGRLVRQGRSGHQHHAGDSLGSNPYGRTGSSTGQVL